MTDTRTVRAFTLIELLVVIAIISVLAAVLFPVFAKAREKARQAACASNEKQLGLGILQYVQDNDEMLPSGVSPATGYGSYGGGWAGEIYGYIRDVNVYRCPNDPSVSTGLNISGFPYYIVSYAFNINLTGYNTALGTGDSCTALSALNAPSNTVLCFEVHNSVAALTNPNEADSSVGNARERAFGRAASPPVCFGGVCFATGLFATGSGDAPAHTGGANYLAADGHVKWCAFQYVSGGVDAPTPTTPADISPILTPTRNATGTGLMNSQADGKGTPYVMTFSKA